MEFEPGTHCIGGWVGPWAGLDGCEKSRPTGIRSPDRPARRDLFGAYNNSLSALQ
jgi:hypothetical protein